MNSLQKSYRAFIESVCKRFDRTDAIRPLQEGFAALCEADTGGSARAQNDTDLAEHLVEKVIRYLIYNKHYYVWAHDTHRYIDSDGWFELEFDLRDEENPNTEIYLTTHTDHDQEFEDEWLNKDDDEQLSYNDIMWDPYEFHDYAYALKNIIECDTARSDLPTEMVSECVDFLKKTGYLK